MGLFSKKSKDDKEKIINKLDLRLISGASLILNKKNASNDQYVCFRQLENDIIKVHLLLNKSKAKKYYLTNVEWNFQEGRSGGKIAGGAIVGTLVAGPLGTMAGAGMGSGKKDQSVAQVTLYDIDEKRELTIAVKCTVDEYSILSSMISIHHSEKQQKIDAASEIRKFKELLDDGIISAEEFEDKKKQLLDL